MAVTRCPHCQAPLPEPEESGAFCTTCGRRVAGWGKAPQAKGAAPLVDGNAVTRRASASDVEGALAAAAKKRSAAVEEEPDEPDEEEEDGGLIDPSATVKLEPPSATKVTDQRPVSSSASTTGPIPNPASVSSELAALGVGSKTPRLLRALGLALAAGCLAAGGAFFLYRVLHKTEVQHPPMVVNLEEPPAPPPIDPSNPTAPRRKAGKRTATTPTTTSATKAGTKTDPPATTPPATTTTTTTKIDTPPATATKTDPPPTATKTEPATTATPPPTQYIPTDSEGETVPPTEEELADEAKAAQFAEGIRFVARRYRNQIEACYERAFKQEVTSPGGRVEIAFTVNKEGKAKKISTITNSTGNQQVSKCIEQLIGDWQFPRPPSGEFNTSYPFVFSGA